MVDTAVVAYFIQRISMIRETRKYRKAAERLEAPFARTFDHRTPKG